MTTQLINPENPYVLNELLFLNQPHFQFNGSTFALFHRLVNVFVPSLGILSACMVAYLALCQTPSHIKAFSKMILLCALSDVFYAFADLWCQARFQVTKAGVMFTLTGPASMFSYHVQCHLLGMKYAGHTLSYLILPVQYVFRYQTLKRNSPPTLLKTLVYVFLSLFVSFLNVWTVERSFCTYENAQNFDFGKYWYNEVPVPQLIVGLQDYPPAVRQMTFFSTVTFLSYALAVFYARRTVTELRKQATCMSARTIAMQRQIGRALFAQSVAPLFTAFIPVIFDQLALQLGVDLGYFIDVLFTLMTAFPLLNSLSTLYFIVPYRKYCLKLVFTCFCCSYKRPHQMTSTTPGANLSLPSNNSGNLNRAGPNNL